MAYEIGTATNYLDLLDRLKEFVTDPTRAILSAGQDIDELSAIPVDEAWDVVRYVEDWDGAGNDELELILQGPGVSGNDEITVGIQTYRYAGVGAYNWRVQGQTGYSDLVSWLEQPGVVGATFNNRPIVALNNASIDYWFFANGRRIMGVAKVGGTYYAHFYLGYYLPYGLPGAYPYPLMVGGSMSYSVTEAYQVYSFSSYNWPYWDPCWGSSGKTDSSLSLLDSSWLQIGNRTTAGTAGPDRNVWPFIYHDGYAADDYALFTRNLDQYPAGYTVLFPLIISTKTPDTNNYGEMQGIYACPCDDVVTEDTVTIDGETYIIFQAGSKQDSFNYAAIKKE
jgi:hypothetical protein